MIDIPKMAAWSVRNYSVTLETVSDTRGLDWENIAKHTLNIEMQRITHDCKVIATVKNLRSVQLMRGAKRGFTNKICLSSRVTFYSPATHLFSFNRRIPFPGSQTDGTIERTFRTLGALPQLSEYTLGVDIILTDGCRYIPESGLPLEYNVTDYVYRYFTQPLTGKQTKDYIEIPLSLSLPQVNGGIDVGDWGDDEDIIIK